MGEFEEVVEFVADGDGGVEHFEPAAFEFFDAGAGGDIAEEVFADDFGGDEVGEFGFGGVVGEDESVAVELDEAEGEAVEGVLGHGGEVFDRVAELGLEAGQAESVGDGEGGAAGADGVSAPGADDGVRGGVGGHVVPPLCGMPQGLTPSRL